MTCSHVPSYAVCSYHVMLCHAMSTKSCCAMLCHALKLHLHLKVLQAGTRKLAPQWVGLVPITMHIGLLAYRLKLPASMTVHDVAT